MQIDIIDHFSDLATPDQNDQAAKLFPHDRYLMAAVAAPIIKKLTPKQKLLAREKLSEFHHIAYVRRADVHYTQHRPFALHVKPEGFAGDCSSAETQSDEWIMEQLGFGFHDPNGIVEWDGFGYTGTLLSTNHGHPAPADKYMTGDIAICGSSIWNTEHAFRCTQPGTAKTSLWWSHGSEGGPYFVRLHYRPDVLGVYRPASFR